MPRRFFWLGLAVFFFQCQLELRQLANTKPSPNAYLDRKLTESHVIRIEANPGPSYQIKPIQHIYPGVYDYSDVIQAYLDDTVRISLVNIEDERFVPMKGVIWIRFQEGMGFARVIDKLNAANGIFEFSLSKYRAIPNIDSAYIFAEFRCELFSGAYKNSPESEISALLENSKDECAFPLHLYEELVRRREEYGEFELRRMSILRISTKATLTP